MAAQLQHVIIQPSQGSYLTVQAAAELMMSDMTGDGNKPRKACHCLYSQWKCQNPHTLPVELAWVVACNLHVNFQLEKG